jgi:hypothetical protein
MGARLEGLQQESSALRASLAAQTLASDEKLELGQLQWALMQARQGEGESRRREAAQRARLHLTQASLYRAQLQCDQRDAQLFEAHQAQHGPRAYPYYHGPRAYPYYHGPRAYPYYHGPRAYPYYHGLEPTLPATALEPTLTTTALEPTLTTTASSLPLLPRRPYTPLHSPTLPYTPLTLPYTPLHSPTLPYTPLHTHMHITYTYT